MSILLDIRQWDILLTEFAEAGNQRCEGFSVTEVSVNDECYLGQRIPTANRITPDSLSSEAGSCTAPWDFPSDNRTTIRGTEELRPPENPFLKTNFRARPVCVLPPLNQKNTHVIHTALTHEHKERHDELLLWHHHHHHPVFFTKLFY